MAKSLGDGNTITLDVLANAYMIMRDTPKHRNRKDTQKGKKGSTSKSGSGGS